MTEPTNLGPRGVRRRARLGALGLGAAGVALVVQVVLDAPVTWTLGLGPLLWVGGLGVFQAREKT